MLRKLLQLTLATIFSIVFSACLDDGESSNSESSTSSTESKYELVYRGMPLYKENLSFEEYHLDSLEDEDFNSLTNAQKHLVANKLLSTLFFGYPPNELQERIDSQEFISTLYTQLHTDTNDKAAVEVELVDDTKFRRYSGGEQEVADILTRFYLLEDLDRYYFHNWAAYVLTQTIMFSPSYELSSSHSPNIERVYNRFVTLFDDNTSLEYSTYIHMISDDNWRRFRSPEDNGREMLEIFALDMDDTHVPIAAKALQNWKLNRDNDTLVISLNENTQALDLFDTTIYSGEDFYRELVLSEEFIYAVSYRTAQFFFSEYSEQQLQNLANSIVRSGPQTWQDILLQIVFSKEYLLNNETPKSAEESFFSLTKKMEWKHNIYSLRNFKSALEDMRQASMKYKLGKTTRVPLDTLSFAHYHKFLRETVLLRRSNPEKMYDYSAWDRQGWNDSFITNDYFFYDSTDEEKSVRSLINHIFFAILSREANQEELSMLTSHMFRETQGGEVLDYPFAIFSSSESRESYKRNITILVLDYISRLDKLYLQEKVQ